MVQELVGRYRGEAKAIGVDGSLELRRRRCLQMEAPAPGSSPRAGLCQGESGSGASLGAAIAKSDRTLRRPCDGYGVQRRLLCAEQE
jgi:hypothetical protein